ncbi:MAG: prepilin-type N-terminal cleavage/methylation domain-containing protein [Chloroflexota bacterium]|nr:prepilin-type N-terminal cleavage/methylation domain-containing protein [Chloroflexota bacterium]
MLQKLNKNRGGFTLVEIMIVVAIIALLAAIAVPNFLRARKRSQATRIIEDLRMIDAAVDQYAIEANKVAGNVVTWSQIALYLKPGSNLAVTQKNVIGGTYTGPFLVDAAISTPAGTGAALSDVAPPGEFWSPYVLVD